MQPSRPISAKVSTDRSRPSCTVWRCRRTTGEVAPPVTDGERAGIQGSPNLASRLEAATIGVNRAVPDTELDDLPEYVARYALEDRYVEAHVSKVLRANWKVDNFGYTVFPNMLPWGRVYKIVYRLRPNADNHRESIMDVFLLSLVVGERKPSAQEVRMGMDQLWAEAEPLGLLGKVFDQDTFNMERGQWGLESTHQPAVAFAAYVEDGITWLHRRLDDYLKQG